MHSSILNFRRALILFSIAAKIENYSDIHTHVYKKHNSMIKPLNGPVKMGE